MYYIQNHQGNFKEFLLTTCEGDIEQYLLKMSQNGTWGGHLELNALSEVLKEKTLSFYRTIGKNYNQ